MKLKLYIETSIVSYLVARPSKNIVIAGHQAATQDMWAILDNFDAYISDMVIQEASKGDEIQAALRLKEIARFPLLELDEEAKNLAYSLIESKSVPETSLEDALHIAVAAVNGMDMIATWNFKHINNPITKSFIRQTIEQNGYPCPEICSPDELLGEEHA